MESRETKPNAAPEKNSGFFKPIGKILGVLTAVAMAVFLIQVWSYYRTIRSGSIPILPQFSSKLSLGKTGPVRGAINPKLESGNDPYLGAENPAITIVEFADFECPFSREEFSVVREMAQKYKDKVRFIYRDYPLEDIHSHARRASIAGSCADAQGKFWQMHDKMYQSADALSDTDLMRYGQEAGLNMALFSSCFMSGASDKDIDGDLADGAALGVAGTPTFFINGTKVEGAIPRDIFDKIISTMLSKQ